jgi:hypothetical protein
MNGGHWKEVAESETVSDNPEHHLRAEFFRRHETQARNASKYFSLDDDDDDDDEPVAPPPGLEDWEPFDPKLDSCSFQIRDKRKSSWDFKRLKGEYNQALSDKAMRSSSSAPSFQYEQRQTQQQGAAYASDTFTEDTSGMDRESPLERALSKLEHKAAGFDFARNQDTLRGFGCTTMDATTFKQQLWRALGIQLGPAELRALVRYFEQEHGSVQCAVFKTAFLRMSREKKTIVAQQERISHARIHLEAAAREQRTAYKFKRGGDVGARSVSVRGDNVGEESDRDGQSVRQSTGALASAMVKFRQAAARFDGQVHGDRLAAFNGSLMTSAEFSDQVRRNISLFLTPAEVDALMHRFESPKSAIARTFDHASGTSKPVVAAAADGSPSRRRQRRAQPHLLDSKRFVGEFTGEVRAQKKRRAEQRRIGAGAAAHGGREKNTKRNLTRGRSTVEDRFAV